MHEISDFLNVRLHQVIRCNQIYLKRENSLLRSCAINLFSLLTFLNLNLSCRQHNNFF